MEEIEKTSNPELSLAVRPQSGLSFIEQLQIFCTKQCQKEGRPYLIGVNENVKTCVLTQPACKMWNCPTCAAKNARRWIAKVINGVNKLGGGWSFLTLTSHKRRRKAKSVNCLREGWKKFYNRILAYLGKSAQDFWYCKVWEQHKDGTFHLHVLCNVLISERWAKDNAAECGMGNQSDWHSIENAGQVAGYMAKYTLKNADMARDGIEWPKGLRRIETSRNWPDLPKIKASEEIGWIVKMTRGEQVQSANRYHLRGFDILDTVKIKDAE